MNTKTQKIPKTYKRLGFEKLDAAEIVSRLNIALSTYQVFYHKLQNFHWNVVGSDFFDVHAVTEEMYTRSIKDIDALAERIRVFGEIPTYRISGYVRDSIISESSHDMSGEFMMAELAEDLQKLIETFVDVHEHAAKNGDIGSLHMAQEIVYQLETDHWKLTSWMNRMYK